MSRLATRSLVAVALAGAPLAAWACGICVEDKVAATYDHAVVTHAAARHHVVVFAAVEGSGDALERSRALERAAARLRGVDRASVRSASAPAALSFALDPAARTPEAALAAIARASALDGVKLTLIKVLR